MAGRVKAEQPALVAIGVVQTDFGDIVVEGTSTGQLQDKTARIREAQEQEERMLGIPVGRQKSPVLRVTRVSRLAIPRE